jgi:hypothetical protein
MAKKEDLEGGLKWTKKKLVKELSKKRLIIRFFTS